MYHLPSSILENFVLSWVQLLRKKDDIQPLPFGSVVIPDSPITDDAL